LAPTPASHGWADDLLFHRSRDANRRRRAFPSSARTGIQKLRHERSLEFVALARVIRYRMIPASNFLLSISFASKSSSIRWDVRLFPPLRRLENLLVPWKGKI
jgi:hypothetical protein